MIRKTVILYFLKMKKLQELKFKFSTIYPQTLSLDSSTWNIFCPFII